MLNLLDAAALDELHATEAASERAVMNGCHGRYARSR
jgi:hypothetical protein